MKDEYHNYLGCAIFFFSIVIIVVLGSTILYLNNKNKTNISSLNDYTTVQSEKNKIDKEKDFIYYTDSKEENGLTYKKAVINIESDDALNVNSILSDLFIEASSSLSTTSDTVCEDEDTVSSAQTLDYATYSYSKYSTITVMESNYACGESQISKISSYTFDVSTGKLISFDDLLKEYGLTYTEVLNKINSNLEENQVDDNIKIENTLNELKENNTYIVYISNEGSLVVKYIVKTNSVDYNDVIEFN
jgi:hypothetical protein